MNKLALSLLLILPVYTWASQKKTEEKKSLKRYTNKAIHPVIEHHKTPKKKPKYRVPFNSPDPKLDRIPFPEIVIEAVMLDETKK